ncbi:hypothetical protein LTR95_014694 [Oleoguttula sp. CCFEE 5521]
MSSAFRGILAYGFWEMNGLGILGKDYSQHYGPTTAKPDIKPGIMEGIAGCRWIFIMQGLITVVVGCVGIFTLVDFNKLASKIGGFTMAFLNEREAAFAYLRGALDLKLLGFACLFGLTTTVMYAIAYFLRIILNTMGFSVAESQCLSEKEPRSISPDSTMY